MSKDEMHEIDYMVEQEQHEQWLLDEAAAEEEEALERISKKAKQ